MESGSLSAADSALGTLRHLWQDRGLSNAEAGMSASALNVAAKLFECIENKRVDGVAALYAEDIAVWHNFSNAEQSKADNLKTLEGLAGAVESLRYEVTERVLLGDRVMQRHNLRCRTRSGEEFVIPACIFVTVRDGLIRRIDEYLDTGQANRLREATARPKL
ncbi:MAG: nuclear transport factor 2 family protein [Gammaproteobacteria bacterium]|nr:nuclear transport factor 2 family protein [Gammaproteobacteria bacterium]